LKRGTDLVYGGGLEPRVHVETPREVLRKRELLGVRHPRPCGDALVSCVEMSSFNKSLFPARGGAWGMRARRCTTAFSATATPS